MKLKIELQLIVTQKLCLGSQQGAELLLKLREIISKTLPNTVFDISLKNIEFMDATFARESIVALAKIERGNFGFCITDLGNEDVIFNIECACKHLQQPLSILNNNQIHWLGSSLTTLSKQHLEFIYKHSEVRSNVLAKAFDLSAPHASSKLKNFHSEGFLLCRKDSAPTGGSEYIYKTIQ